LFRFIQEHAPVIAVDPSLAETFRRGEEKAAELAAIPDTPELERADEAILRTEFSNSDGEAQSSRDKLARMVERYCSGPHRVDSADETPPAHGFLRCQRD
jgi:hypothetical protein